MRVLGLDVVPVVALTGEWHAILGEPRVAILARSIEAGTQLQEPMVRRSDMRVVFGNGRVAAHQLLKRPTVMVKLVDCTDHEASIAKEMENAHRVHNQAGQREAEDRLVAMLLESAPELPEAHRGKGRQGPRTRAGWAIAEASALTGTPVGTLKLREYRKRKPLVELKFDDIRSFGRPWTKASWEQVEKACFGVQRTAKMLVEANAALSRLKAAAPVQAARIGRIQADLSELANSLKGLIPVSVCPTCKGLKDVQAECVACETTGLITKNQALQVPKKLWDPCVVVYRGKEALVEDFEDSSEVAASESVSPPDEGAATSEESWGFE